jgi:hypothetical protein
MFYKGHVGLVYKVVSQFWRSVLMVKRNCVIHITNLYDVTKWIIGKVVAISKSRIITESHKLSCFQFAHFQETQIITRTFSCRVLYQIYRSRTKNVEIRTGAALPLLHHVYWTSRVLFGTSRVLNSTRDVPRTDICCTDRVQIFCIECTEIGGEIRRWRENFLRAILSTTDVITSTVRNLGLLVSVLWRNPERYPSSRSGDRQTDRQTVGHLQNDWRLWSAHSAFCLFDFVRNSQQGMIKVCRCCWQLAIAYLH